jgi:hypothetical protein
MTEANEVEFHEKVGRPRGRSAAVRIGIVAGAAAVVVIAAVTAMGASPVPSTRADPAASTAPGTATPSGKPAWNGAKGSFGLRGGDFARGGFRDITVTAINGFDISLKTDDGWTRTITVTNTTTITKGGATIALGDLAVGDQVRFAQQKGTDGTYSVTAIVVVLPTVVGEVTAIDGNTLTITQPGGTTATIHVGSNTTYRVNGATGALSDIKVGSIMVAEGTQRADGSLDAAAIRSGFGDHAGRGPGFGRDHGGQRLPNASPAPSSGAS